MILVLTMAGRYQRFTDEGYTLPKYLLPWKDRTILWTILSELLQNKVFSDVYLVGNHRDENFMPHVRIIMEYNGIPRKNLILIPDTTGQAQTAFLGIQDLNLFEPVVFANVDTILYNRDLTKIPPILNKVSGYIDVFEAHNKEYSFVLVNDNREVTDVAEKILVSDLATSGLYGFSSVGLYRTYFERYPCLYISSIYKNMIEDKGLVIVGEKHKESDTIVLGTPQEYIAASLRL